MMEPQLLEVNRLEAPQFVEFCTDTRHDKNCQSGAQILIKLIILRRNLKMLWIGCSVLCCSHEDDPPPLPCLKTSCYKVHLKAVEHQATGWQLCWLARSLQCLATLQVHEAAGTFSPLGSPLSHFPQAQAQKNT